NKVARVVDEYGLDAAPAELEAAWTRTTDRKSLRELADDLNRRLLRSAMREAGLDPIDADVGSAYRALTDDSDGASRVQKARELERQGVDVDSLQDDFVSHQAIHTYLRRYRNVEPPESDDEDRLDAERDRVERLQGRMRAVAEDAVGRLRDADEIALDGFDVVASIDVHCEECGRSYRVGELLRRGGCACQQPE
ncbi:MAG: rod-determining factor RdfA, partial [Halodesulfurarchaeum sp.]